MGEIRNVLRILLGTLLVNATLKFLMFSQLYV